LAVRAAGLAQREGDTEMCKRMNANNRANTANLASLRNACRFAAALLLVLGTLAAEPAFAERPDVLWVARGRTGDATSVAFSADGGTLASGSHDSTVKLWNTSDGKLIGTLKGHDAGVASVAFSPDGRKIASGSYDKTVKFWSVSDGKLIESFYGSDLGVSSVAAAGSWDAEIWLFDPLNLPFQPWYRPPSRLKGHTSGVTFVAFSPGRDMIASGSYDNTVKLWRTSDRELIRTLKGHTSGVSSVAFSPGGDMIASGSYDKTVKFWSASEGKLVRTLEGHTGPVYSVAFSPDGRAIASAGQDNTIRFWRVLDGALLKIYDEETEGGVNSFAFSPDGRLIAWACGDGTVVVAKNPFYAKQSEAPPQPRKGDLNEDGKVAVSDAVIALRIAVRLQDATEVQLGVGDIDGNGRIDISDATKILRAAIGLEVL